MNRAPILQVKDLSIGFVENGEITEVIDKVSFVIEKGEIFGLAGESGCGKTVTSLALLRLLPQSDARILSGSIQFKGEEILALPIERMRQLRGNEISMIFQEPSASLNPLVRIERQLRECFEFHSFEGDPVRRVNDLLRRVGLTDLGRILRSYPHELSGGMLQRVMIAMALLMKPDLIIADEPTTALDVTVQAQIMELIVELQKETGTSILLITHNLNLIVQYAAQVAIMYAGRIAEQATVDRFLNNPLHPYSKGLLQALPDSGKSITDLTPIPGQVPQPKEFLPGCRFFDRCPHAFDACRRKPKLMTMPDDQKVACFLYEKV